jgi:Family of unknown function (DUF6345)
MTRHATRCTLLLLAAACLMPARASAQREGGYVYNRGESRFVDNVYNFLKHFSYEQYYWADAFEFTTNRSAFVDNVNLAYYSGHGSNFSLGMGPGASVGSVNLRTAGGYGSNLRFIVFQSCEVIPSVPDLANWWGAWVPGGIFQGLHQAIGYRTLSYSGNGISNNYGNRVRSGQAMWQGWFAAVNDERSWWRGRDYPGFASVVLYPGLDNDTYLAFGPAPPHGHGALRTYYQY